MVDKRVSFNYSCFSG